MIQIARPVLPSCAMLQQVSMYVACAHTVQPRELQCNKCLSESNAHAPSSVQHMLNTTKERPMRQKLDSTYCHSAMSSHSLPC